MLLHFYWLLVTVVYSLPSTKHNQENNKTLFLLYVSIRLGNNVLKQRINDTNCNTVVVAVCREMTFGKIAIFWSPTFFSSFTFSLFMSNMKLMDRSRSYRSRNKMSVLPNTGLSVLFRFSLSHRILHFAYLKLF